MTTIASAAEWPNFRRSIIERIDHLHLQLESPTMAARDVDITRGRILELRELLTRCEPPFIPVENTTADPGAGY